MRFSIRHHGTIVVDSRLQQQQQQQHASDARAAEAVGAPQQSAPAKQQIILGGQSMQPTFEVAPRDSDRLRCVSSLFGYPRNGAIYAANLTISYYTRAGEQPPQ